jgi:hypothetical protein
VDPHATKVVAQQVVKGVPGKEAQAIGDPVGLIRVVVKVGLGLLAKLTNGLGTLLVGTGPDAQRDTVQSVRRVLLEDKGVVGTVRLALAGADFNVVGEASLYIDPLDFQSQFHRGFNSYPHGRVQGSGNLVVLF